MVLSLTFWPDPILYPSPNPTNKSETNIEPRQSDHYLHHVGSLTYALDRKLAVQTWAI